MADTTFTTTFSDPALVVTTVFGVGVPGPVGPTGPAGGDITNAAVNAAIATDAAATRTSLGLGSAALLTASDAATAGQIPKLTTSGTLDITGSSGDPIIIGKNNDPDGVGVYGESTSSIGVYGAATSTNGTGVYAQGQNGASALFVDGPINGTSISFTSAALSGFTSGLGGTTHDATKLIKWDATAAATRSNLGITATGDTLATAASRLAAQEAMGRRIAYKTSDETRTATITLADDSTMVLALEAGSVYEITARVEETSGATPGFKFRLNFSSALDGANGNNFGEIMVNGVTYAAYNIDSASGQGATITRTNASTRYVYKLRGTIRTLLACNMALQWAQNASDASAATMNAGSHLTAFKVYPS